MIKILNAAVPVDRHSRDKLFHAFGLVLEPADYRQADAVRASQELLAVAHSDWGEAPDVSLF